MSSEEVLGKPQLIEKPLQQFALLLRYLAPFHTYWNAWRAVERIQLVLELG